MTSKTEQKTRTDVRFYHPDHLGSTTVVTDLDGEVTQNVAYIPYGEVFVEQRNGTWSSPYLFNAKELDEETGLYYYGARYINPKDTRWLSVDPMFEKYVGMTPYGYCAGNPVGLVDVDGRTINDEESLADAKHLQISAGVQRALYKLKLKEGKGNKEDLENKISELTQTIQDIDDMIADNDHDYKFQKVDKNEGNETYATDEKNIVVCYNSIGTKAHESRHGGQIARGKMKVQKNDNGSYTLTNYTVDKEVDAYRAQVAIDGGLTTYSYKKYMDYLRGGYKLLTPDLFYRISADEVNQITEDFVKDILQFNESGIPLPMYNFNEKK